MQAIVRNAAPAVDTEYLRRYVASLFARREAYRCVCCGGALPAVDPTLLLCGAADCAEEWEELPESWQAALRPTHSPQMAVSA